MKVFGFSLFYKHLAELKNYTKIVVCLFFLKKAHFIYKPNILLIFF